MKLKAFNQSNLPFVVKGKPTVRFALKSGLITISPAAAEVLGINSSSKLELCQNEAIPSDWYVHATNAPSGFPLRGKKESESLSFNCTSIVKKLFDEIKFTGKACSYLISSEPEIIGEERYWYIITKNPINAG